MIKGLNLLSILYYFVISQSTTLLQMPSNENLISQGNQIYGTTKCVLLIYKYKIFMLEVISYLRITPYISPMNIV